MNHRHETQQNNNHKNKSKCQLGYPQPFYSPQPSLSTRQMSTNEVILDGLKKRIRSFFEEHYDDEVHEMSESDLENSIEIDYKKLQDFDSTVADDLANSPEQWMTNAKAALEDYSDETEIENPRILIKGYEKHNPAIRNLRDKHLGKLVRLDGTVSKATGVLHKAHVAAFECRKCGSITKVKQPLQSDLEYPTVCSGDDCDNRVERDFRINPTLSETINFRKVEIQEPPEETSGGETPETQTFTVKGDIADNVTAGDNVTGIGIYRASEQGNTSIFQTYVKGVNIVPEEQEFEELEITDEDKEKIEELAKEDDIYEQLRDSIAPNLYDLEAEKEAVLYQLFRGVRKTEMDGTNVRGDIHVLFCGDPGTGKSLRNSKIIQKNGNIKEISDFVENLMDDPTEDSDGDLIQEVDEDVEVLAMDKDAEIESRQVEAVWKKKVNNALKIELKDGRKITSSDTHPLFTTDGDAHIKQIKAGDIDEDDYIAVPRKIDLENSDYVPIDDEIENKYGYIVNVPDKFDEEFAEFLGLMVAEGSISISAENVGITNSDDELIRIMERGFDRLVPNKKQYVNEFGDTKEITYWSRDFAMFFKSIDESLAEASRGKRVPEQIFKSPKPVRKAFLRTYIDGEVHVDESMRREMNASSMSKDLLHDVQRLLDTFGIPSRVKTRTNKSTEEGESYRLRITGKAFNKYVEEIGFVSERKQERAETIMEERGDGNTNVDVVPDVQDVIKETRELLGMTQHDFSIPRSTYHGYEYEGKEVPQEQLQTLVNDMVGKLRLLRGFEEIDEGLVDWETVDMYLDYAGMDRKQVAQMIGHTQGTCAYHIENNGSVQGHKKAVDAFNEIQYQIDDDLHRAHENLIRLESLAWGDVRWVPVESVEEVECDDEWMYDLQVEGVHNYIANGIMSHNSQLLRYASKLAPRGVMTSGQGASEAGLTAAAVRDSEFGGEDKWTLKAGALVLADQGLACVDEIDKMDSSDRSAMHEGLEQQTISVSKAGINSTLKSRCTLLAAANPKDGRWNEFDPVPAQIDLEPALVSRFDMIFAPEDERTEERDTKLADHILSTNLRGQQLEAGIEPDDDTDDVEPDISPELFKKYVAYSRQNYNPVMTEEAMEYISEFFVNIRAEGEEEGAIPVTARKIEGIVRVSEAAARIELNDRVEKKHAERAKEIVMRSLKDVGYDEEAGRFDIDMTETNQSTTQRDRRNVLIQVIEENEDEGDDGAPRDLIIEIMTEEYDYREDKVDHDLRKLGREGKEVYEPSNGEYATM